MKRCSFYYVDRRAYLYQDKIPAASDREDLEEPVRQWCAFELIRAYGIQIADLSFEEPVSVGSRRYRIDILVSRNGRPWAVVECKKRGERKHENALDQAVSYADALRIKPQFAVFTNGEIWNVRRLVEGKWVPVPDLPVLHHADPKSTLVESLYAFDRVGPLLAKLDETLAGEAAQSFLAALQQFFHGTHILVQEIDHDLKIFADNMLRALVARSDAEGYWRGKLSRAQEALEAYRQKRGLESRIPDVCDDRFAIEAQYMGAAIQNMLEDSHDLRNPDVATLRLMVAVLDYARQEHVDGKPFPPLTPEVHHELRGILDYTLSVSMGISLPDKLDRILVGDMKGYCRPSWERVAARNSISFSALLKPVLRGLKLWR